MKSGIFLGTAALFFSIVLFCSLIMLFTTGGIFGRFEQPYQIAQAELYSAIVKTSLLLLLLSITTILKERKSGILKNKLITTKLLSDTLFHFLFFSCIVSLYYAFSIYIMNLYPGELGSKSSFFSFKVKLSVLTSFAPAYAYLLAGLVCRSKNCTRHFSDHLILTAAYCITGVIMKFFQLKPSTGNFEKLHLQCP